jgi:hypothetical protein
MLLINYHNEFLKNEPNIEGDKPPDNQVDFLSLRDDRLGREKLS